MYHCKRHDLACRQRHSKVTMAIELTNDRPTFSSDKLMKEMAFRADMRQPRFSIIRGRMIFLCDHICNDASSKQL